MSTSDRITAHSPWNFLWRQLEAGSGPMRAGKGRGNRSIRGQQRQAALRGRLERFETRARGETEE